MLTYQVKVAKGVDPALPGLYEIAWVARGVRHCYIGRYSNQRRPREDYNRSLRDMLRGKGYHTQGRDFRPIHYALYEAWKRQLPVELRFLSNDPTDEDITINNRLRAARAGRLRCLNCERGRRA